MVLKGICVIMEPFKTEPKVVLTQVSGLYMICLYKLSQPLTTY